MPMDFPMVAVLVTATILLTGFAGAFRRDHVSFALTLVAGIAAWYIARDPFVVASDDPKAVMIGVLTSTSLAALVLAITHRND